MKYNFEGYPLIFFLDQPLSLQIKSRYDDKKNNSDYTGSEQYTYVVINPWMKNMMFLFRKDFAYLNKMKKKTRKDLVEETTVEVVWSPSLRRWYVIQVRNKGQNMMRGLI